MKRVTNIVAFFSLAVILFSSCKKDSPGSTTNKSPLAEAVPDKLVILPIDSTELIGMGSDIDGSIVSYEWSRISGPPQNLLLGATSSSAKLKNLERGTYVFELKVTDNSGGSAMDRIIITVVQGPFDPCLACWGY
jgi:hypothetical protein